MNMTPTPDVRRGAGRTMATLLAAQLWARTHKVAVVMPLQSRALAKDWVASLDTCVRSNIIRVHADNLEAARDGLAGLLYDKVFVDHHVIERSEANLERKIEGLRKEHAALLVNKETIR